MPFDPVLRDAQELSTSPDRLADLSSHRSIEIRIAVAKNATTPLSTLKSMVADLSPRIRQAVAQNPALPDDLLVALSGDASTPVRQSAALGARGRPDVLSFLVKSTNSRIREILAGLNGHVEQLGQPIQAALARDESWEARARIAESTKYRSLFEMLMADPDARVRGRCGANPRATIDDIERLIADRSAVTRRIAVDLGTQYPSEDQLMRLARDPSAKVQWAVIVRVGTPRAALEIVSKEGDEMNRRQASAALTDGFFPGTLIASVQQSRGEAALLEPFV